MDSVSSSLIDKLNELVLEARAKRRNTKLIAFKVEVPWRDHTWKDVEFYNSHDDSDVTDHDALVVKYMTGADVPPHVTLAIVDPPHEDDARAVTAILAEDVKELQAFECDKIVAFEQTPASKNLGAKGRGVVMQLKIPRAAEIICTTVRHVVHMPIEIHGKVEHCPAAPVSWTPHVTVGYVRESDQTSLNNLQTQLQAFIGKPVRVTGWAPL